MISAQTKRTVRSIYSGCCGYCGVCENDIGAVLTIDHFHPQAHGGDDSLENLVYCCHACNAFKGDYWPEEATLRLLHPLQGDMGSHIRLELDGRLVFLTDAGQRQIERLQLNRPPLVRYRLARLEIQHDMWTRQEMLRVLARLEQRLQRLEKRSGLEP